MDYITAAKEVMKVMDDKKASDILALDVTSLTVICDAMVIATGRNTVLVKAIADAVDDKMAELGFTLKHKEGAAEGRWVILDYGDIIVHVFHPEERTYYNLERLWGDNVISPDEPEE